jgi:ring-1,2-phenylacetyl-CoA epoxidase subunit PaaE
MLSFKLQVAEMRTETSDVVTVCLKQPGLKKVKYLPGQYLTLIFRINGRKYVRPYSFSSAPGVDSYLEITVKRVPYGIVSNHINDFVKAGDWIEVIPPMGDFVINKENIGTDKYIVLWGAGSGITPLFSIAKYILYNNIGSKVRLAYGNRNVQSVIFAESILNIERQFGEDFKAWHFHTNADISKANENVIHGRVSPSLVFSLMEDECEPAKAFHYICGPQGLKESVKKALKLLSVPEDNVFTEDFEVVRNLADFEEINTQIVEIIKEGKSSKVEVTKGNSILNAGLDALLDIDYSCQTGSCLLCKCKVLRGKVKMIGAENMRNKLEADECLMCCGYPLSNDVQLSVL